MPDNNDQPPASWKDKRLESLLGSVQDEISQYASRLTSQISRLSEIGIALSSQHDLDILLEMIVEEARLFTLADAGTLYILENNSLQFKILQNDTFRVRMGGTSGQEIKLPPVPLSKSNVSAYAAITGETVNIPDVYNADGFDFTGPRKYDEATGYKSTSMIVVPMLNLEGDVIGVLQLLNAKDPRTNKVVPFAEEFVSLTKSLASQAAVAITNARLFRDMENLFDSFVNVMATAIDERSPYTGGHIKKVAALGLLMCEAINDLNDGKYPEIKASYLERFKNRRFSKDQLKEMKIAGWMHDLGKITTPVHIVDKSMKLETIIDRIELVKQRFQAIIAVEQNKWLERKISMLESGNSPREITAAEAAVEERIAKIRDDLRFLTSANKGGEFMDDGAVNRVREIASQRYYFEGVETPYLTESEAENLVIRKGTLLESERKLMQDHIVLTIRMLEKIPFTKKLANVTRFAGAHHESLNGTGYPNHLKGDEIPLEGRILALVDFYEALTAYDRPYKKSIPVDKVYEIMKMEVERGKLDGDLFDLFVKTGIHEKLQKMFPSANVQQPPPRQPTPAPVAEPSAAPKK
ncbi:MAG: GAF domain-containing protein [Nitrospinae bacterium]|nr:GAF domain-containing protein [Nitrospinota bacterium]